MKIAQFDQVPEVVPVRKGFRGGDIRFKDLLIGTPGQPDNFGLQWVTVDDAYDTPQHRHNFEQVRIMMEGSFGFGPGLLQEAGSVGYFCESTYYTQKADKRSVTLLLQVGGPSGAGFMSRAQLRQGIDALARTGEFNDGVYTWYDEQGKKHNQDSYEAAWEHIHGRKLSYAKPQYTGPILMQPERFAWTSTGTEGVSQKRLGRFNERGLEIAQLKLEAHSSFNLPCETQPWIVFCIEGSGVIQSLASGLNQRAEEQPFLRWTSLHCQQGDTVSLHAREKSEFWILGLPVF